VSTQAIIQCASESAAAAAASEAFAGEILGVTYTGTAGSDGDFLCLESSDAEVTAVEAALPEGMVLLSMGSGSHAILHWASREGRFAKALLG
jgi:hypothetical protein